MNEENIKKWGMFVRMTAFVCVVYPAFRKDSIKETMKDKTVP